MANYILRKIDARLIKRAKEGAQWLRENRQAVVAVDQQLTEALVKLASYSPSPCNHAGAERRYDILTDALRCQLCGAHLDGGAVMPEQPHA